MILASKLDIPCPESLLGDYVCRFYSWYDGQYVSQDCTLSEDNIWLSRELGSRLTYCERDAILAKGSKIGDKLQDIPSDVDLLDIPEGGKIPGERALSELITIMCNIPGVKLAKTAKIIHKKRPGLIPVLDSVVECHYWPRWVPSVPGRRWGDYAIALIRTFHRDMHSVAGELREMRDQAGERGTPLTPCRILDILIWSVKTNRLAGNGPVTPAKPARPCCRW